MRRAQGKDVAIIWNIIIHGDKFEVKSTCMARNFPKGVDTGWGYPNMIEFADVVQAADAYRVEQGKVIYVPSEEAPAFHTYTITGTVTFRIVEQWDFIKLNIDMTVYPRRYLYLTRKLDHYPVKPIMVTHESRAQAMLEAAPSLVGEPRIVTFLVGPAGATVKFDVHMDFLNSLIRIPLVREGMKEGLSSTVSLPEDNPASIRVFVKFIYTLQVSDSDMRVHGLDLFSLSDRYDIPTLRYMVEWYHCWRVQVIHSIIS
jgi:hypothetical protein